MPDCQPGYDATVLERADGAAPETSSALPEQRTALTWERNHATGVDDSNDGDTTAADAAAGGYSEVRTDTTATRSQQDESNMIMQRRQRD